MWLWYFTLYLSNYGNLFIFMMLYLMCTYFLFFFFIYHSQLISNYLCYVLCLQSHLGNKTTDSLQKPHCTVQRRYSPKYILLNNDILMTMLNLGKITKDHGDIWLLQDIAIGLSLQDIAISNSILMSLKSFRVSLHHHKKFKIYKKIHCLYL